MRTDFGNPNYNPVVEFSMGSLYGHRTFHIEKDGSLGAVSWPYTWTPGENIAECHNVMRSELDSIPGGFRGLQIKLKELFPEEYEHDIAKCPSHGFYAYTDSLENEWHHDGRIQGVIEGYGVVHQGTNGFRAEKAKIVGLVMPNLSASRWKRIKEFRSGLGIKGKASFAAAYFALWFLCFNLLIGGNTPTGLRIACGIGMVAALSCLWMAYGTISREQFSFRYRVGTSPRKAYAAIKEKYPDVPIFKSNDEMLEHFKMKEAT